MSLSDGLEALKQKRYTDAIAHLDRFLATSPSEDSREYYQAQTALVRAYHGSKQYDKAIALCRELVESANPTLGIWAQQSLDSLQKKANSGKNLLKTAKAAHKEKRYPEAIAALQTFLKAHPESPQCGQVRIMLVKAYKANKQIDNAISLCVQLLKHEDPLIQTWAQQAIGSLRAIKAKQEGGHSSRSASNSPLRQAGRAATTGVRLAMVGTKDSLALVSTITLMMLGGMLFTLFLALTFIVDSANPTAGLGISVLLTIGANLLIFFLSPFLLDLTQSWLYGTRWVSLADIERYSPESARVIQRVCQQKKLQQPRLGIINDETPTAFTYGSLPNTARIVVSQGLFTYLEDEEAATVYAHELGHVVHWDFAVMTIASTLVQITYLVYVWLTELGGNDRKSEWAGRAALLAYIFYIVGTYLQLYLSRIREYYADRFAAQTTGNPNALSRALVKIAYGVLEVNQKRDKPNRLTEGTRALGIYDPRAAASTGTAYRVANDSQSIGRIFLWDLFNPWAFWMELNSTHPLTGKRVRALSTYAEQLGLESEFDMVQVVREGRLLDKKRLYGNFFGDLLRYLSPGLGFALGSAIAFSTANIGFVFLFGGIGVLLQAFALFPRVQKWQDSDVFSLMCDPYASPFRPIPATLKGQIIGRGDSGYAFGSDMMFQDDTGLMYLHYASFWGPLGNFFFGATQVQGLMGNQGKVRGWFRRGIAPYMDMKQMAIAGKTIGGYHDTWLLVIGGVLTLLGVVLMFG